MGFGGALNDVCYIGTKGTPSGVEPTATPTYSGTSTRCRVSRFVGQRNSTKEVLDGSQAAIIDCEIRVPQSATIVSTTTFKVTRRDNETLGSAEYYQVVGQPIKTGVHYLCNCRMMIGNVAQ